MAHDPVERFSPATRTWFRSAFPDGATPAQEGAWAEIEKGGDTLLVAPTGSGKTLAAFLWSLDRLATTAPPEEPARRCRVLYVSPLKALAADIERNLRAPLAGIRREAERSGADVPDIRVGMRTGDTPQTERRGLATDPPDVLITTPESLFLVLTSQARAGLTGVETVIVDEVHAVVGTKRGAHLALSLERLDALLGRRAQRIGLSATVRPREAVAGFLGGAHPAAVVAPPSAPRLDLRISVPVEDMADPAAGVAPERADEAAAKARTSLWPHVEERVLDLVGEHRSSIVFTNSRRVAERLCARLNELASERAQHALPGAAAPAEVPGQSGQSRGADGVIARAHHGSVSKEERAAIEADLKEGRLPCVVATSSLELGIDMGAVDLVVQVESPPSVAGGLQRVGRAGHAVGEVSRGVLFPKYRGDLLASAVVAERMRTGAIEELAVPVNPLDVLAQQIVAMASVDAWAVEELAALVRRAAPFATLPDSALSGVLDMLSGRYPSDEFADLRPRLVWDREEGTVAGRPGAQRLAVTSGGTIPDRGTYAVHLAGAAGSGPTRVGELDEEMVYESRVGDVFVLGSTAWRIESIDADRVLVAPAPGRPGRLPFWKADAAGRPPELGRAIGALAREMGGAGREAALERARGLGLDGWAADNLVAYVAEQQGATGAVPDDRTVVVERFRDELGDWRVVVHSPLGARVHGPWALALGARIRERYGLDAQVVHGDDGIVLRLPDVDDAERLRVADLLYLAPEETEDAVTAELGGSALFAARFRECAGRALLLPRRRPGHRMPLWQQRQRSAQLLSVAGRYGSFPIVLEAVRECLRDVFDVPGLAALMADIRARRVRLVEVETPRASPFAQSLLIGYTAEFLYEGDAPLAELRAQALTLDSALLAELLGRADLRELLDAGVLADVEASLQRLTPERGVAGRGPEGAADLLRELGPLTGAEAAERGARAEWLAELEAARRAIRVRVAGEERWAAAEDAARLRDGLGVRLPGWLEGGGRAGPEGAPDAPAPAFAGSAEAFAEPVDDPLGDLLSRYARTHGPFTAEDAARRFGLGPAAVREVLRRLAGDGRLVEGGFRPGGSGSEWCDTGVLRRLRKGSVLRLRKEAEPVPQRALGRFLPAWQHASSPLRGPDAVFEAVESLRGCPVPASALESLVLPARVHGYTPSMLDELTLAGEVVWAGVGPLGGSDGWVCLVPAEEAPELLPDPGDVEGTPLHAAVEEALDGGGALFFRDIADRATRERGAAAVSDAALVAALWDLVWAGRVGNDTLAPLRALLGAGGTTAHRRRSRRPVMPSRMGPPTVAGRWWRLPEREQDPTRRGLAAATALLDRYGVVTRGPVVAEQVRRRTGERSGGGFSAVYPVLRGIEEAGKARRGYFVEGLGAAQFAPPGAVDRLRSFTTEAEESGENGESGDAPTPTGTTAGTTAGTATATATEPTPDTTADGSAATAAGPTPGTTVDTATGPTPDTTTRLPGTTADAAAAAAAGPTPEERVGGRPLLLAAADPANPYGAALPWPEGEGGRPARKAGSLVVLDDGAPTLYLERGGKSAVTFGSGKGELRRAAEALAEAVREGGLDSLTVERADGGEVFGTLLEPALREAGFHPTPKGLRLR